MKLQLMHLLGLSLESHKLLVKIAVGSPVGVFKSPRLADSCYNGRLLADFHRVIPCLYLSVTIMFTMKKYNVPGILVITDVSV